ncbi:Flp pilus assembly protein CpaB [Telmatobacter sp. DSM 110680]|uniref:Flp pilus assembly protein CpaB n=1 Tax=Telmatobacter sp. DSM 110680 TaxID=3036704 RepID=A0AAU7DI20_9BACT
MNRRLVTILLAAFVVAALCSVLVYRLVGMRIAAVKPQPSTRVVAAATDIKIGTVLSAPDLTTVQIMGTVPKTAILDAKNAIGRGVTSSLYAGEPILEDRLAPVGSGGGLAATIKDGMRAIAVRVDQVVGVAGFVTPGMHVDVLISGVPPTNGGGGGGGNNNTQVRTVLQNIEVLSAGTDIQKDAEGKPLQVQVVNLLVTPEQAQVMALASNETRIQLVLRNPLDTKVASVQGTAMTNLFLDQNAPASKPKLTGRVAPAKPKPETFTVTVINGSTKTESQFAAPGGKQ